MSAERILSLDMSTKTGWAVMDSSDTGVVLVANGQIPKMVEPVGSYPINYVDWAHAIFDKIRTLIVEWKPDVLTVEETAAGSKNSFSQKILEFIHFLLASYIKETKIKAVYFLTEQWRRETGCLMSAAESKHNKAVKEYKKKNASKIAYDTSGKRVGKITRKHVNVRRANEVFGSFLKEPLRQKDEDTADSLLLGYAYHLRRMRTV